MARFVFLLLLATTGCASTNARTVFRDRETGVVAIPENSDRFPNYYRSQAKDIIEEHVGRNYEIDREEEYVLGPVTVTETRFSRRPILNWLVPWKLAESATSTNTNTTRNQTEYRLHYRRVAERSGDVTPVDTRDLPPLRDGIGWRE